MRRPEVDFVLALHSHLPYVLNHGRWPHGSDWICEAAIDTYLPLVEALGRLRYERVSAPLTIGITPILANQLASPVFTEELESYFTQRLITCEEAPDSLRSTGDEHLIPLADFWRERLTRLRALFRRLGGNLLAAFRSLEGEGRLEIIGSAATHGFLPLLSRDESIRLQLGLGRAEHRRLFGRDPAGLWLPECAYRARGPWAPLPGAPGAGPRRGIEEHVSDAGFSYFFTDAHLADAGRAFRLYGAGDGGIGGEVERGKRSPYRAYRVASPSVAADVAALVRDPISSRQVWSRQEGYPGDEWYLEFHKIRWPGGLKFWRVSAPGSDLGAKHPYVPGNALTRADQHADHFVSLLQRIASEKETQNGGLIAVPFDTELFGHWWFEGVDFLASVYRHLGGAEGGVTLRPLTASAALIARPPRRGLHLSQGSWGANGDFSMWLNPGTEWTWRRLWAIEQKFWDIAGSVPATPAHELVLAQAAREMLLAQASDWQFIISTGQVTDYAVRRFTEHCADAELLIAGLEPSGQLAQAEDHARKLWQRDHVFPQILPAVRAAMEGSRAVVVP
jgi:1,4-alpha-glucan branching enzyme